MQQGALPFHYAEEKNSTGHGSLATYLNPQVSGPSVERHVGIRRGTQGWTDSQMVTSLILLNLAGGESVDDLRVLEKDGGFGRVLRRAETHVRQRERRALQRRWRKERRRSVPSCSAVFGIVEVPPKKKRRSVSRTPRSYPLRQMR